jgi:hypothetical protein
MRARESATRRIVLLLQQLFCSLQGTAKGLHYWGRAAFRFPINFEPGRPLDILPAAFSMSAAHRGTVKRLHRNGNREIITRDHDTALPAA